MICPHCKKGETSVVDSRPTEDGTAIRRRRLCICGQRFTTFERVQFRELVVIKKNGRKSSFDRDKLSTLLKYKYKLHVNYDPCSYPGIQVKFYYNAEKEIQNGICLCKQRCDKKGSSKGENQCLEISFMIFRTGSVLIVGHCDVFILNKVYVFLKTILETDYIDFRIATVYKNKKQEKKKKIRKKIIIMDAVTN